ncbi:MAG: PDZ domain-containing protein [Pirellulaceae bacterium]|nr:PDZ domain-containing protein [Pirellulaceae bacterium]
MNSRLLLPMIGASLVSFCLVGNGFANESNTQTSAAQKSNSQDDSPGSPIDADRPVQAELGIRVSSLPPMLTSHLPDVIDKGRGILVADVTKDSPAQKAGLRNHDVLIRYDDQDLYSPEQLIKRVRNDKPGTEVELQYVRAGKLHTATVTLGQRSRVAQIERNWPGFSSRFDVPLIPYKPDFLTEQQDTNLGGTEWTHFESMSVTKAADGSYRASVKYKGNDGASVDREYTGTRQEVRDAVKSDADLPDAQKKQLLRSLDDRGEMKFRDIQVPDFPRWAPWSRDLLDWPELRF